MIPYLKKKVEFSFILQSGLGWGMVGFVCLDYRTYKMLG